MTEHLIDLMEEIIHLDYVLTELHHYSRYDLEKVRYEYYSNIKELHKELSLMVNSSYFKDQMKSDKIVADLDLSVMKDLNYE